MQGFRFNPNEVEDDRREGGFQPVPEGEYSVILIPQKSKRPARVTVGTWLWLSVSYQ